MHKDRTYCNLLNYLHILSKIVYFSGSHTLKPLEEKRFEIVHQKLDFYQARKNCIDMGAKLFEPLNTFENEFVMKLAKKYDLTQYWIGIYDHNLTSSNDNLISWNHYEPLAKPVSMIGGCTKTCTLACFCNNLGLWKDQCCSLKRHSVCDYDIEKGKPLCLFSKLPKHFLLV